VLDFGVMIFEGTAQEMLESEVVRTAYLGRRIQEEGPELRVPTMATANRAQLLPDTGTTTS
jgi:hypothetical protein